MIRSHSPISQLYFSITSQSLFSLPRGLDFTDIWPNHLAHCSMCSERIHSHFIFHSFFFFFPITRANQHGECKIFSGVRELNIHRVIVNQLYRDWFITITLLMIASLVYLLLCSSSCLSFNFTALFTLPYVLTLCSLFILRSLYPLCILFAIHSKWLPFLPPADADQLFFSSFSLIAVGDSTISTEHRRARFPHNSIVTIVTRFISLCSISLIWSTGAHYSSHTLSCVVKEIIN